MNGAAPVLVAGRWRPSAGDAATEARSPTGQSVGMFPVSPWDEVSGMLEVGMRAYEQLRGEKPDRLAEMLRRLADRIEAIGKDLAEAAHLETALPVEPRLLSVELPRATDQLRQAAQHAATRSWVTPILNPNHKIASMYVPLPGVVVTLGPNNFPFAFNAIAGGDFAAAIATGHPVIAKANPGHPETTRLLADEASIAAEESGLPPSTVQLVYHMAPEDGLRLVADSRVAATAFTGSKEGGLALKEAADKAGRPIYLEMSSINPVVLLPAATKGRTDEIAAELASSMLLGAGQFCTNPGVIFVPAGQDGDAFVSSFIREAFRSQPATMLGPAVVEQLEDSVSVLLSAGAEVQGRFVEDLEMPCAYPTTILSVGARAFSEKSEFQREAFGNVTTMVRYGSIEQLLGCVKALEGNLTGTIYGTFEDDAAYAQVAPELADRVGRLISNKPPTGVAVVPAMNHGGPFPATGHPAFTAVGFPRSLQRFALLRCFDNVDERHLPPELKPVNPLNLTRLVEGEWTSQGVVWGPD